MEQKLLILGAGGYGRTIEELARELGAWESIAFLDDASPQALGPCAACAEPSLREQYAYAYPAFGDNALRLHWCKRLLGLGYALPRLVHPRAWVSASAAVEDGAVVLACAAVGAGTRLCMGSIVNLGALVDHSCVIGAGAHLAPGVVVKAGNAVRPEEKLESGTVLLRAEPDTKK